MSLSNTDNYQTKYLKIGRLPQKGLQKGQFNNRLKKRFGSFEICKTEGNPATVRLEFPNLKKFLRFLRSLRLVAPIKLE